MRAASCALRRVYSRFEPGGVSIFMMNSERSSTGKNADPTVRIGGTICGSMRNVTTPTKMMPARDTRLKRLVLMPNTITAIPITAAARPVIPRDGNRNDAKKLPAAMTIIDARWSSAHAITLR